jgi:hypothetical protein
MSHFTTVKTVIRDQALLCESLKAMHLAYQEGERVLIRGYQGNRTYGEVVVSAGPAYDIGFQRGQAGSFAVCADWWGVQKDSPIRQEAFLRDVNRTYAHLAVRQEVLEQGFLIEEEHVLANGEIELVVVERP